MELTGKRMGFVCLQVKINYTAKYSAAILRSCHIQQQTYAYKFEKVPSFGHRFQWPSGLRLFPYWDCGIESLWVLCGHKEISATGRFLD